MRRRSYKFLVISRCPNIISSPSPKRSVGREPSFPTRMKNSPTRAGGLTPTWRLAPLRDANEKWWSDWDRLNDQSLDSHPLLTSVIAPALRSLCACRRLYSHAGRRRVSAAQLILVKSGRLKWSVFTPSQAPVSLLVFDRTRLRSCPSLDRLCPCCLGPRWPLSSQCRSLCSPLQGSLPLLHKVPWGTTVGVNLSSTFDGYWESRSKELKHNMRRYLKRISEGVRRELAARALRYA